MDSMPTDTLAAKAPPPKPLIAGKAAHDFVETAPPQPPSFTRYVAPRDGYLATLKPPGLPSSIGRALKPALISIRAYADHVAADIRRRRNTSIGAALALNVVILTFVGIYGTVQIWIPSAPGESHVVMVTPTPPAPMPELREDLTTPEPVKIEPEIVKEPELTPEPDPLPTPEPEPVIPLEPEPAPEPEPQKPVINLAPEPVFAPPAKEERGALVPEPPAAAQEPSLSVTERAAGQQSPESSPEPLVEPGADRTAAEAAAEEARRREAEEAARLAAEKAASPQAQTNTGDDAFDEEPVLGSRKPLPKVDLPAGAQVAAPGASGVVAIFCPEEFKNKDKAAECAGRTEIRSGWKPGSSGEDWSEAVRLLKQARERGQGGADPATTFSPEVARRLQRDYQNKDAAPSVLGDQRPATDGFGGIENKTQKSTDTIERGLGRPSIGPAEPVSADERRDPAPISDGQIRKLEKALDEAEKAKKAPPPDNE